MTDDEQTKRMKKKKNLTIFARLFCIINNRTGNFYTRLFQRYIDLAINFEFCHCITRVDSNGRVEHYIISLFPSVCEKDVFFLFYVLLCVAHVFTHDGDKERTKGAIG